jgi:hypothetical protein
MLLVLNSSKWMFCQGLPWSGQATRMQDIQVAMDRVDMSLGHIKSEVDPFVSGDNFLC